MSRTIHAYAAHEAKGELVPFEFDVEAVTGDEVEIEVKYCGLCHSDLSMINNDWGNSKYPFVGGHEVVGVVSAIGPNVTHVAVGDKVGVGWGAKYCQACEYCIGGDHNLCVSSVGTIVGHHGGFADYVRVNGISAIKLPDNVNFENAGPLFCGGITVFNPLLQYSISPTARVAVIGIGGLGHLALKFFRAWGCHVTAFTSSPSKVPALLEMGAHSTINSRDADELKGAANSFDLIISTVNVNLDWNAYLGTLRPKGRLHFVGVNPPITISTLPMLFKQLQISSSPTGSPASIARMLDFCGRHSIEPITEHFPMSKINEAVKHLADGKARFRIVLDRE